MLVSCQHCGGTGKVKHVCQNIDMRQIVELWRNNSDYNRESLVIKVCKICKQLYKIRYQNDPGTGCDDIWLKPGESERGFAFTEAEAKKYRRMIKKAINT